jgi:hypothetical protein
LNKCVKSGKEGGSKENRNLKELIGEKARKMRQREEKENRHTEKGCLRILFESLKPIHCHSHPLLPPVGSQVHVQFL